MASTSASLIGRLGNLNDPASWQEFENRYRPRLMDWCRSKGLQDADAENVTQEVLLRVVRLMQRFVYRPGDNFSGLLRTIWRNAWIDWVRSNQRVPGGRGHGEETLPPQLLAVADDDLVRHLEREIAREEVHEAMARTQPLVSERDWQLFLDVDIHGRRSADVASERGMTIAAVGMAVKRVRDQVKQALAQLRES